MTSDSRETVPDALIHASEARRPKPYIEWFFGCILFSLISIVIGLAFFEESGVECFLCREDIGWALVIFAYATPGLAMGSVIWAIMWMRRSWRESKPEQFKPTFVVLLVATTLLVANIHYFYSIPAAKNNLNFNPELAKSIVKVSSIVNPYPHPDEPQGEGYGTGIVVDSERVWIVTNAHVARRVSSELSFQFSADPDEHSYPAEKLYVDPYLDLAILKGSGAKFPSRVQSVPLECGGKSETEVVAMGYAEGRRSRFMIVKGERLGTEVWNGKTWFKAFADYQRGMSGGPTLNGQSGRVVGINTLGTSGYWDGEVGFTIPARYVCRIVDLLRKGVDPTPPQMPLAFYDNLSSDGELVVAESDLSTSQTSLAEGDEG
jgi:S1-C subfamily serine protease